MIPLIPAAYQLLAKVIAGAVLMAALTYAWHQFTGHYIDRGRAEMQAELQPTIDALEIDKQRLQDAYTDLGIKANACSDSVRQLHAESEQKKAAGIKALAEAEKRASGLQQQAQWLAEQLAKPDTRGKTCADAWREWRAQP